MALAGTVSLTVCAMHLLHYALLQVAKLSRSLQAEKIDLTAIASLDDATPDTMDNTTLQQINYWMQKMI